MQFWQSFLNVLDKPTQYVSDSQSELEMIDAKRVNEAELYRIQSELKLLTDAFTKLEVEIEHLYTCKTRDDKAVADKSVEYYNLSETISQKQRQQRQLLERQNELDKSTISMNI